MGGMKVLITTSAGLGHIHPMVPLARAMLDRGHDVLWAVPPVGVERVEAAGFRALAAGPAGPTYPNELRARYRELDGLLPAEVPDFLFSKVFGAIGAPAMLADLEPTALAWRPDLVIADAAEFAGHLIAAELGIPSVTKGFGPLLPERRVWRAGEEVADLWRARQLSPRPYGGAYDHLYLDVYPAELSRAAPEVPHRRLLRPESEDWHAGAPGALPLPHGRPDAPLVYVTMGTVFHDGPIAVVLEALAALDVRVLATVGPSGDPSSLGPQPSHVRVERYVPQSQLLPMCDAVVSHAGSGTVLTSTECGLPQLCLPQGADQFLNAAAIASSGAGLSLEPQRQTVHAIRDAVERLLTLGSYRSAACRIGTAIQTMPSAMQLVAELEALPESTNHILVNEEP